LSRSLSSTPWSQQCPHTPAAKTAATEAAEGDCQGLIAAHHGCNNAHIICSKESSNSKR
jgi:hypothetical protein